MTKRFIAALLITLAPLMSGVAGPFPIITDVTIDNVHSGANGYWDWDYGFQQTVIDTPAADVPIPYSWIGIGHKHNRHSGGWYLGGTIEIPVHTEAGDTWSTAAMRSYNSGGSSTNRTHHTGGASRSECVGYMGYNNQTNEPWTEALAGPLGCTQAPPVNNTCDFQSPQILIDHGVKAITTITGSVKSGSVDIKCLMPTTIHVHLLPEKLDLGGITSTLTAAPSVEAGPEGASLEISSTLEVSGSPAAGEHQAAGIVRLDYE